MKDEKSKGKNLKNYAEKNIKIYVGRGWEKTKKNGDPLHAWSVDGNFIMTFFFFLKVNVRKVHAMWINL